MLKFLKKENWGKGAKKLATSIFLIFILCAVTASVGFSNTAHAQVPFPTNFGGPGPQTTSPTASPTTPAPQNSDAGWMEIALTAGINTILVELATFALTICGALLWASALIFETVLHYSVVDLGRYIGPGSGVLVVWETFRDFANMFFIFILLYVAIATVLDLDGINVRKTLTRVIIVALLINFSFFFTKVAVDASNIISIGFYNQIVQQDCGTGSSTTVGNIGNAFMCKLGLTNLWSADALKIVNGTLTGGVAVTGKILTLGVMGSIFILIAAFIFLAAGVMFIARFVTLIYLFMLSPLAFAAMALPNDEYSKKWFNALTENCILAPAYMAATWAALKIINEINPASGQGLLLDAILGTQTGAPAAGAGQTFLNFLIIIAMMVGTLIVAKQFGGYGAEATIGMLKDARGWVQGKIGRGIVRPTIGALDKKLGDTSYGRSWAGQSLRNITTRQALKAEFGSGRSVEKVDKEVKKNQEDFVKDVQKDLEKKLDKNLPKYRGDELKDNQELLSGIEKRSLGIQERSGTIKSEIERLKNTVRESEKAIKAGATPDSVHIANVEALEKKQEEAAQAQKELDTINNEKQKVSNDIKTLNDNIQNNAVASKEEKSKWLPGLQKDKAKELEAPLSLWKKIVAPSYAADRKKVADELKKSARPGGGAKDTKAILEDILAENGEKPAASSVPKEKK